MSLDRHVAAAESPSKLPKKRLATHTNSTKLSNRATQPVTNQETASPHKKTKKPVASQKSSRKSPGKKKNPTLQPPHSPEVVLKQTMEDVQSVVSHSETLLKEPDTPSGQQAQSSLNEAMLRVRRAYGKMAMLEDMIAKQKEAQAKARAEEEDYRHEEPMDKIQMSQINDFGSQKSLKDQRSSSPMSLASFSESQCKLIEKALSRDNLKGKNKESTFFLAAWTAAVYRLLRDLLRRLLHRQSALEDKFEENASQTQENTESDAEPWDRPQSPEELAPMLQAEKGLSLSNSEEEYNESPKQKEENETIIEEPKVSTDTHTKSPKKEKVHMTKAVRIRQEAIKAKSLERQKKREEEAKITAKLLGIAYVKTSKTKSASAIANKDKLRKSLAPPGSIKKKKKKEQTGSLAPPQVQSTNISRRRVRKVARHKDNDMHVTQELAHDKQFFKEDDSSFDEDWKIESDFDASVSIKSASSVRSHTPMRVDLGDMQGSKVQNSSFTKKQLFAEDDKAVLAKSLSMQYNEWGTTESMTRIVEEWKGAETTNMSRAKPESPINRPYVLESVDSETTVRADDNEDAMEYSTEPQLPDPFEEFTKDVDLMYFNVMSAKQNEFQEQEKTPKKTKMPTMSSPASMDKSLSLEERRHLQEMRREALKKRDEKRNKSQNKKFAHVRSSGYGNSSRKKKVVAH
eukprot:m.27715 g.27715  ORF g.27715 m.27715 type:complete len:686 (+) comp7924_c0_seq1:247-2304(+)